MFAGLLGGMAQAQTSACSYSTCIPLAPFTYLDNFQIYGAILASRGSSTVNIAGTATVTGNVGGFSKRVTHLIDVSGTYTPGLNVGGVRQFTAVTRAGQTTATMHDFEIFDMGGQSSNLIVDFYKASPTGTFVNGQPSVLNDFTNYIGSISVLSTDYVLSGGTSRLCLTNVDMKVENALSGSLFFTVTITAGGGATYVSGKLYAKAGFTQD